MSSLTKPRPGERDARQRWATPEWLVRSVERWSGAPVVMDVCAEEWSRKAPEWLGPGSPLGEDALSVRSWWEVASGSHAPARALWCNPPFGDIEPWVQRAHWEVMQLFSSECRQRCGIWLLVPPRTWCDWYSCLRSMERAHLAHRTTIDGGRIAFEPPRGVAASSPMGSCELWWVSQHGRALPSVVSLRDMKSGAASVAERQKAPIRKKRQAT